MVALGHLYPVTAYHIAVPISAFLYCALLGFVIHMNESKAFFVAKRPFKVIHKRPLKIAAQVYALLHRAVSGGNIAAQKINAVVVNNLAVYVNHAKAKQH